MGFGHKSPLSSHPNFRAPEPPPINERQVRDIVNYTLKYVAELISPPKVNDEDEDRECNDVADEVKGVTDDILERLNINLDKPLPFDEL